MHILHEINTGIVSVSESRLRRERGGYAVPVSLYLDALSVHVAVSSTFVNIPADNSVLCHVQYIRELLDLKILTALIWCDTRDMLVDGLAKGSIEREMIHSVMGGTAPITHTVKVWKSSSRHHLRDTNTTTATTASSSNSSGFHFCFPRYLQSPRHQWAPA